MTLNNSNAVVAQRIVQMIRNGHESGLGYYSAFEQVTSLVRGSDAEWVDQEVWRQLEPDILSLIERTIDSFTTGGSGAPPSSKLFALGRALDFLIRNGNIHPMKKAQWREKYLSLQTVG